MDHFQEAGINEQIEPGGEDSGWLTIAPVPLVDLVLADGADVFEQEVGAVGSHGAAEIPPERRIAIVTGGAMDTHGDKQLRDPEDRVIDDCNQEQRRDKAMDKILADSFPASDPPAWQS